MRWLQHYLLSAWMTCAIAAQSRGAKQTFSDLLFSLAVLSFLRSCEGSGENGRMMEKAGRMEVMEDPLIATVGVYGWAIAWGKRVDRGTASGTSPFSGKICSGTNLESEEQLQTTCDVSD